MEPTYATASFRELATELGNAVAWLNGLGVRTENTRIAGYHQTLVALADNLDGQTLEQYFGNEPAEREKKATELIPIFLEVGDVTAVYKWLSATSNVDLQEKLKRWVRGPSFTQDEKGDSIFPRSTAFELLIAAQLVRVGLELRSLPPADLMFEFENRRVVIECKRPISLERLHRNVKEAFKQVETRAREGMTVRVRGVIAIDVTKILNPTGQPIVETDESAKIGASLTKVIDQLVEGQLASWSELAGQKSIGILLRVCALMIDKKGEVPVYCQQYGYATLRGLGARDHQISRAIGRHFSGN